MKELSTQTAFSRRKFLFSGAAAAVGGALALTGARPARGVESPAPARTQPGLALPDLPYAYDALEPTIDARTMEIHYGRHHAGYARNLADALQDDPVAAGRPLESLLADINVLPSNIQTSVRNNGGGHWNHNLFWEVMSPEGGGEPVGVLGEAIDAEFGDFETMREQFSEAAATRFGSGWAWLMVDQNGALAITSTPNQDNPLMRGIVDELGTPILGLDVWEHAYYLLYQNRRGDYINAWWDVVNWPHVDTLYRMALG